MPKIHRKGKRPATHAKRPCLDVSNYRGEWIAIHPTTYKIIGHGASLEAARQSTPDLARIEPVLYFVPKSDAYFVGRA